MMDREKDLKRVARNGLQTTLFWGRNFFALLVVFWLFSLLACAPVQDEEESPAITHVLLISLDALRADHLESYGYDRETSPFLDELAAGGIRFSQAFANTHGTPPSHATMLSSLYQESHRVGFGAKTPEGRDDVVPEQIELLPEILQDEGWHTVGVTGGGYMSRSFGFSQGFEVFSDRARSVVQGTGKMLEALRNFPDDGKPVFAFYHTYEIHSPYLPPPEYRSLYGSFSSDISPTNDVLVPLQTKAGILLNDEDFDFLESQYDAEIRYTDDTLRTFFSALEEMGFLENCLVILTADHGEEFGDHGGLLHRATLYEELIHVPLIVFGSDVPSGRVDPGVLSLIDITPTILESVGIRPSRIMGGRNFLSRKESPEENRVFSQYTSRFYSLRTQRWKLILRSATDHAALYDLRHDPDEHRDLAGKYPERVTGMRESLEKWLGSCPDLNLPKKNRRRMNPETLEELKALGYVESE